MAHVGTSYSRMEDNVAAPETAAQKGITYARQASKRVSEWIHDDTVPWRVHLLCFIGGVAVIADGVWGVVSIWNVEAQPIFYILNVYQVFFGLVTVAIECQQEFAFGIHVHLAKLKTWIAEWAAGLNSPLGKMIFYLFQGTLAVITASGLWSPSTAVGIYLYFMTCIMISLAMREYRAAQAEQGMPNPYSQQGYRVPNSVARGGAAYAPPPMRGGVMQQRGDVTDHDAPYKPPTDNMVTLRG